MSGSAERRLACEEAVRRVHDFVLTTTDIEGLFPQLEQRVVAELRKLDVQVVRLLLHLPAERPGHFVEYSAASRHLAPESAHRLQAEHPWVQEAWQSGEPVSHTFEQGENGHPLHYLELPLTGGGSLAVGANEADVFDEGGVESIRPFATPVAHALQRLKEAEICKLSQDRLSQMLETTNMSCWEWDLQSDRVVWSENLGPLLALSSDEFNGRLEGFLQSVHHGDRQLLDKLFHRTVEEGSDYDTEFRLVWPDESVRWARVQGRVFFDEQGKPSRLVGVIMDITRSKHLEDEMHQLQKMETVGRLAGGIAHDFNNMLQVIGGSNSLLDSDLEPDDPRRKEHETIEKTVDRAAMLTSQLLTFSRKQHVQPKVLDVSTTIAEMHKMLRRLIGEDIEIVTVFQAPRAFVRADPGQVEQIIVNLAANARDAMPEGGKITFETACVEFDEFRARRQGGMDPGPYVRLTVSDTGCGMDEKTLASVFDPFFTTKEVGKGTGLGLSTIYGIVEQSNGSIEVASELGEGTTFTIYLPQVEEELDTEVVGEQASAALLRGSETILLAEDELAVQDVISKILTANGYELLVASNGTEALELCERHEGSIDLLVADIVMPNMGGRELARSMAERRPETKLLFVSGYQEWGGVQHEDSTPEAPVLYKPFAPVSLLSKVREVLGAAG